MWIKIALVLGMTVLFFAVSGALAVANSGRYVVYFYSAAGGLSLIAAALVSMIEE